MTVIAIARTPSLNASSRPLVIAWFIRRWQKGFAGLENQPDSFRTIYQNSDRRAKDSLSHLRQNDSARMMLVDEPVDPQIAQIFTD
jgi:hypothetical protein